MEKRTSWRVFLFLISVILILLIVGDIYLRNNPEIPDSLLPELRQSLLFGSVILAAVCSFIFVLFQVRIYSPLNHLVLNLKKRFEGDDQNLEPLHYITEIGPLLYNVEVLLKSLTLQIQEVENERETLSSVLSQITDGIVMVDERGEINSMNPAAERIFEIDEDQALGHTVAEVLRHHQWIELYRDSSQNEVESSITLEIPGQKVFLQGIAIPLGESLPGNTLMVFQDLSQIRRLETTRRDFISNISHELRTPLASLKALAETLQESALDDPAASRRFLKRMDTEVDALTQLVTELLELSRIESGRVPLDKKPTNPETLLSRAFERLRAQADRKKIQVEINNSNQLPEIMADPRRVEQVLVNLLHNAIKFSEPGGKILMKGEKDQDSIVLSVQDFGTGISERDLERIFERFYKTDQARSSGGTGLGLSIARHLVEAHDGEIWAESALNEGSTFYFSLPIQSQEDTP
jgi:two-component system phosphate regulon sensor histidine kinase PhoR